MTLPTTQLPERITSFTEAVEALERLRQAACQVSEWTTSQLSEHDFGGRTHAALVTQARVQFEAATAVVKDLERLMRLVGSESLELATAASVLGTKITTMVIEPIQQAPALRQSAQGLRVND